MNTEKGSQPEGLAFLCFLLKGILLRPYIRCKRYGRSNSANDLIGCEKRGILPRGNARQNGIFCNGLADGAADYGLFHDSFFVKFAVQQLILHIIKAEAGNRIGKAFAGDAFIAEEKNGFFHRFNNFLL